MPDRNLAFSKFVWAKAVEMLKILSLEKQLHLYLIVFSDECKTLMAPKREIGQSQYIWVE